MDDEIKISENDEPWENYQKLVEINNRLKKGVPLKTSKDKKYVSNYEKIFRFINKLLKHKGKKLKILTDFKSIPTDFFDDEEEIKRVMTKYGVKLVEELKLEFDFDSKNIDVFKFLKLILSTISYKIRGKRYEKKGKIYYSITEKNQKLILKQMEYINRYLIDDTEYDL